MDSKVLEWLHFHLKSQQKIREEEMHEETRNPENAGCQGFFHALLAQSLVRRATLLV